MGIGTCNLGKGVRKICMGPYTVCHVNIRGHGNEYEQMWFSRGVAGTWLLNLVSAF